MNLDADGKPVVTSKPTEHKCEKCGTPMVLRDGRRGPFLACTGYPKCKNIKDVDANGNPIQPVETGINCEKCGSPMIVKKGRARGAVPGLQRLSEVPQQQAAAGRAEGEAGGQGPDRAPDRTRSRRPRRSR